MTPKPVITREIALLPKRASDAHKGDAGRLVIIGGCVGDVTMVGAPALAASAAFRSGAGLVQMVVPRELQTAVAGLAPCATTRALPPGGEGLERIVGDFGADAVAVGPGLGDSVSVDNLIRLLTDYPGPIVVDADGLNLLAMTKPFDMPDPRRVILTPHPGEMHRLLAGRDIKQHFENTPEQRISAAIAMVDAYGSTVALKGKGTVVTDGRRMYINETGNSGMATGGMGDVLTGIIAALLGQKMSPLEATILGVYLHGLAGDFSAEELGRVCMTATDVVNSLPEAFGEQEPLEG